MEVYRIRAGRAGAQDTLYLGVAKIPDPRLREEGAFLSRDQNTGVLIRLSEAWIISDRGLRRTIEFDPRSGVDQVLFRPGPHDEVISRQGAQSMRSAPGRETVFDLADLYAVADVNPLRPDVAMEPTRDDGPRTALLTMRSTYPRGESVDLVIHLVPRERPSRMQSIQIVRRDTTIFIIPAVTYLPPPPHDPPSVVTLVTTLETGYGPRHVNTHIPASRAPFTTQGVADLYYVDGSVRLERSTHRWVAHVFGMSSLTESDVTEISHHQIALRGGLRFEYGTRWFAGIEAGGRLADKPHQEFTWSSADYAASLLVGAGRRIADPRGLERHRVEAQAGVRMGENRVIEVYRAGERARGLGAEFAVRGRRADLRFLGADVHLTGIVTGYSIAGRGPRDAGFQEQGLRAEGDIRLGTEVGRAFVFGAARAVARREKARYPRGGEYYMNDVYASPAAGVEMRL
jgi:hypothetical protein